MHIFIQLGEINGRKISYLSMYLLYIVFHSSYHFLKNFIARYARSIAFYPPLRNASMQSALRTNLIRIFLFFVVIISDCQLPKFTENTHKIAQIANKMSKNCLRGWGLGKKRGDVRIVGGRAPWLLGGDRRPWKSDK